jgi:hypothetical protein
MTDVHKKKRLLVSLILGLSYIFWRATYSTLPSKIETVYTCWNDGTILETVPLEPEFVLIALVTGHG